MGYQHVNFIILGPVMLAVGVLSILGVGRISGPHRNKPWTKAYMRDRGIGFLLAGVLWMVYGLISKRLPFHPKRTLVELAVLVLGAAVVGIVFLFVENKYQLMLEDYEKKEREKNKEE